MSQPPNQHSSQPRYEPPPPHAPRYQAAPPHQAVPPAQAVPPPQAAPGYPTASAYQAPAYHAAAPAHHAPGPQAPPYQVAGYAVPGPAGIFDGAIHAHELNRPLYGATLGQAFHRFFKNYANFRGRASRSEYWWMTLIFWGAIIALTILATIVESLVYRLPYSTYTTMQGVNIALGLLVLAIVSATLVPWLAVAWRRLHDANLPGPLFLLCLVPYLGGLAVLVLLALPPKPEGRRYDPPTR